VDLAVEWADELIIIKDGRCLAQGGRKILSDERIIREANLRFPVVTRIFNQISGLNLEMIPQTVNDAIKIIKSLIFRLLIRKQQMKKQPVL
jgi:cobalt/nickel transport system ATP-binding protein